LRSTNSARAWCWTAPEKPTIQAQTITAVCCGEKISNNSAINHRRDLQDHRIGKQNIQPFRLIEQQRQRDAADGAATKPSSVVSKVTPAFRQHLPVADGVKTRAGLGST
jgi:hypothetical protein